MEKGAPVVSTGAGVESADSAHQEVVVLVVPVRVAVLEVLDEGVVAAVLRVFELSTSPSRRLAPISGVTASDHSSPWWAQVSVVRLAVGLWPSGSTGFNTRSGMMTLIVMQQALRKSCVRS
jgi:hypothetical protein